LTQYIGVHSEGGLIPYEVLVKIAKEESGLGQQPKDFGLPSGRRLTDEIARAWSDAQDYWHIFQRRSSSLPENETGATLTRKWITDLLNELLGYELAYQQTGAVIGGKNYPISHRAGASEESPPVQIEGFRADLDRRPQARRLSPQALVQEYLNNSDSQLWGIVTNGFLLRLLRDTSRTSRPSYLEFDLQSILEGNRFNEFAVFYRVCHRTRLPRTAEDATSCWLEKYFQHSVEQGGRVRDKLRDGVEDALKTLGTGFLRHPKNDVLRERIKAGTLTAAEFHRQLLRLVYRLLFLMVAEERRMIVPEGPEADRRQSLFDRYYSVGRLRSLAEKSIEPSTFGDLWIGLQQTFTLFEDGDSNPLGIPPLNGDLFSAIAVKDLQGTHLYNTDLLAAMERLSLFEDHRVRQRVNYAALDVEELGSVYESLLDYQPVTTEHPEGMKFELPTGGERKSSGSYYTRPELVRELIESALVPVMKDRLDAAKDSDPAKEKEKKTQAILSMSVCDPACGSGHFLLAAARRLGRELAKIKTGEEEPIPKEFHLAVRDVIAHCVYGVDINPLAVDLCKLALWLEGHWTGKPLSFLDHRIKCGNSLIGVLDPKFLEEIPDDAFTPVTGDVKSVASAFKRKNKAERKEWEQVREQRLLPFDVPEHLHEYAASARQFAEIQEETPADVRRKAEHYGRWRSGMRMNHDRSVSDVWTYAFFAPLRTESDHTVPTHKVLMEYLTHVHNQKDAVALAEAFGSDRRFFHWKLEFPDIFEHGGFDVLLGNPPWEKIKLEEQEHWIDDSYIRDAPNKAERDRRLQEYRRSIDPAKVARVAKFEAAKHYAEAISKFVRHGGRYPLTAVGDINTYALFAELFAHLTNSRGRSGAILPTQIAIADTTKLFFNDLIKNKRLISFFNFFEVRKWFPATDDRNPFGLLTIGADAAEAEFAFFLSDPSELVDKRRRFAVTEDDFALFNPNTRTCPIFRTRTDVELTKKIYENVPILVNESISDNAWGVGFMAMFHMANDSHMFASEPREGYLRLYEAKLFHQYDHRWATYEDDEVRRLTSDEKASPETFVRPRYWVPTDEVLLRASEVPPALISAVRANSEEMARAVLIPWWAGYAESCGRDADADKLLQATVSRDLWNMSVQAELGQYILNSAVSRSLQRQWPLTERDMNSILPCKNFIQAAHALVEMRCPTWLTGFRRITRSTDERTVIAAILPLSGTGDPAMVVSSKQPSTLRAVLLACLNSLVLDYVARQKISGTDLRNHYFQQLPVIPPTAFRPEDLEKICNIIGQLTFTASDLSHVAGEFGVGVQRSAVADDDRALLRGELDAYYAHLYSLTRDELRYILDPKDVFGEGFPSETFRVLKEREEKEFGEYRTRRLVLEAFDKLADSPRFRDEMPKRESAFSQSEKNLASVGD
jgi:hypothetical protein